MTCQVKTHFRLGIHSGSPSDQSPRCPHEKTFGPYLSVAKFRGVSPRNLSHSLCEMLRSFSANFRRVSPRNFAEEILGEISDFYFSPRKHYFAQGVFHGETRKNSCFLGLICTLLCQHYVRTVCAYQRSSWAILFCNLMRYPLKLKTIIILFYYYIIVCLNLIFAAYIVCC